MFNVKFIKSLFIITITKYKTLQTLVKQHTGILSGKCNKTAYHYKLFILDIMVNLEQKLLLYN